MSATPTEVMYALIDGVTGKKWDDLPPLYAEDTVVEHPMNTPRATVLRGREALRRHFDSARDMPMDMSAHNIVVHQTTDPETVIGEFEYHVRPHGENTKEFVVRNIYVLTVRDGLILRSRDYADHLAFAVGMDRLTPLVEALQRA
ncbi:nuclear transport factor 2 family protein [Labedaea rhizosphaerae]|uniref:Ketosteroid isomerase-like protein n=1 Tax=Labedaea rhizosphaerae TaxID=598644 RepID=A0A4R6S8I1_LABRH|nr:nuclear transport factor 2 family protein [Labedaea rhizosphaerae]TDP96192.1 ketosteroid isomerase-like protein [Labedaea rhizosphaerae]